MDGRPLLEAKDAGLVRKRLSMHFCMDPTLVDLLVDIDPDIAEAPAFGLATYLAGSWTARSRCVTSLWP